MTVTIEIPDELVPERSAGARDRPASVVEAIELDAYRNDRLTEAEIRQLLPLRILSKRMVIRSLPGGTGSTGPRLPLLMS